MNDFICVDLISLLFFNEIFYHKDTILHPSIKQRFYNVLLKSTYRLKLKFHRVISHKFQIQLEKRVRCPLTLPGTNNFMPLLQ